MKTVTIVDVAEQAGVSKKTVSRVINNEDNVSAATREKVLCAIDELGFTRNPLGRALAQNRSFFIALLSDNPSPGYSTALQKGLLQSCSEEQMGLFIFNCSYRSPTLLKDVEDFIDHTLVDGLILTPPLCDKQELLELLDRKKVHYIRIGPNEHKKGEYVRVDSVKASYEMTKYLLKLGHVDIGFVKGHPDQASSRRCERGFRQAFAESEHEVNESLVAQGFFTYQSGVDAASVLLSQSKRPTAIFASNDEMATGVLYGLQSRGLRVPEDISICGIDDIALTTKVWPNITTMRHPLVSLGYKAANMLIARLKQRHPEVPPIGKDLGHTFDCELIVRESVSSL